MWVAEPKPQCTRCMIAAEQDRHDAHQHVCIQQKKKKVPQLSATQTHRRHTRATAAPPPAGGIFSYQRRAPVPVRSQQLHRRRLRWRLLRLTAGFCRQTRLQTAHRQHTVRRDSTVTAGTRFSASELQRAQPARTTRRSYRQPSRAGHDAAVQRGRNRCGIGAVQLRWPCF